ncbi:MAG: hypothetical protein HQL76_07755 [Magnetococcales bacterium]|nr:hypothetical protein [Magnetococcales bacterium]
MLNLASLPDKKVRSAISAVVDRNGLQTLLGLQGNVTTDIYPPALFPKLSRRQEISEQRHDDDKSLRTTPLRLVAFEDVLSRAIAEQVARDARRVGLPIEIQSVPFPVLVDRLNKGDYDLLQLYWGPFYADLRHFLAPFLSKSFPPSGNNFNRYRNPAVDLLVDASQALADHDADCLFSSVRDMILRDAPIIPLYFGNLVRASNGTFAMPLHPLGYRPYKLAVPINEKPKG